MSKSAATQQRAVHTAAAAAFAGATVEDCKTAYVKTFVQVGQYGAGVAQIRRWIVEAIAAKAGAPAAAEFVIECGDESIADYFAFTA
jgi:hypothetical protein